MAYTFLQMSLQVPSAAKRTSTSGRYGLGVRIGASGSSTLNSGRSAASRLESELRLVMKAAHSRRFSLTSEVMEPVHCGTVNSRPFTTAGKWTHSNFLSEGGFDVGVSGAA